MQANNPEALVRYIKWTSTAVLKAASAPLSQVAGAAPSGLNVPLPLVPDAAGGPSHVADVW